MCRFSRVPRFVSTVLLLAFCLLCSGCTKDKVTKANFDKITKGMSLDQVEAILGKGTKDDSPGAGNVAGQFGVDLPSQQGPRTGETYVWEKGEKRITVIFLQDKVFVTNSTGL